MEPSPLLKRIQCLAQIIEAASEIQWWLTSGQPKGETHIRKCHLVAIKEALQEYEQNSPDPPLFSTDYATPNAADVEAEKVDRQARESKKDLLTKVNQ